jgi:Glycosyltransferase Family 4
MKSVLILVFSNLKHDARVGRQLNFLRKNNHVTIVCFDGDPIPGVEVIKIKQTNLTLAKKVKLGLALILRLYPLAYRIFHDYSAQLQHIKDKKFDLIVANDVDALPLAFAFRKKAKVILDAHEYAPRHFENSLMWRTFFQPFNLYLCKKYIPQVDGMTTVGKGLADEYETNFGKRPVIITNAAKYHEIDPYPVLNEKIRLIHHGIANQARKLELMIEMMNYLDDRFTLDMILMTSDYASGKTRTYIQSFKEQVSKDKRIKILPGVKSAEVVDTINKYDVGVFLIPPINFNYANTLPNKLFDFIQARLAVAVGPTPEMASIVKRYDIGVVSEDFQPKSLAAQLNLLTVDQLKKYKVNTIQAAKDLNAEKNELIFMDMVSHIL